MGLPRVGKRKRSLLRHVINSRVGSARKSFLGGALLMSKLLELRWLDIGLVLYCVFIDLEFVSVHKNAKKNLANIQPS